VYNAKDLRIEQLISAVPAEYWEEAQEIRDALNLYIGSGKKIKQLQEIVEKMENDEFDIDELAAQLKAAQRLIKLCKDKLSKTEEEILKIQADGE